MRNIAQGREETDKRGSRHGNDQGIFPMRQNVE
jgi:hypothetical protein